MSDLNVYASKIYGEHPLAIWSLDSNVGVEEEFPQYTTTQYPAFVSEQCTQGVPMVYGSRQSIRLANLGEGGIEISQPRTWAKVLNDPDTLKEEEWEYWKNKKGATGDWLVEDWLTEDRYEVDGIFPPAITHYGYGLFTNAGKYNTYTSEFWMRIDARTTEATRIWGSYSTLDGLWVNDNYITLVVGKENKSYAVENWYRPMLVNVTYTPTQARLLINGQEVITLSYVTDDLDFTPLSENLDEFDSVIGFAVGNNVKLFEVDCISLYSYIVPDDVLKRRFVWGQGVRENTQLSTAYETQTTYIDYPYSEYSNNVIYPDLYSWESGYANNLISTRQSLKTPAFELPEIFINGRNRDELYLENLFRQNDGQEAFFTFQPEYNWDQPSYLYFNNINKLTEPPQSIYGVFQIDDGMIDLSDPVEETLMRFEKESGEVISITARSHNIYYYYMDRRRIMETPFKIIHDAHLDTTTVGFEINKLLHSESNDPTIARLKNFFANLSDIKLYVGGDGNETFSGFIYKIGIADTSSAARNNLSSKFDANGIASESLLDVYSSYTLVPRVEYGEFWLDVAADSYWEDAIALSLLGKNLDVPTLDFFQFNIGHDGAYEIKGDYYDFSKSELQAYVAFQPIEETVQKSIMDFEITEPLPINRVVRPVEIENTKYAVVNGSVIYPPEGVNYYEYRVLIFFDILTENAIHAPFQIKNLSLAPQAYEENSDVGTLFGSRIQSTDPFAIYKESTPYLYLTKDSGVEPLEGTVEIPFNENQVYPYPVNMITAWIKPNFINMKDEMLLEVSIDGRDYVNLQIDSTAENTEQTKTFRVVSNNEEIPVQSKLYKNDETLEGPGLSITLDDNQWAFVGIELPYPLPAGSKTGRTILHTGAVFQNVTVSKVTTRGLASISIIRDYADLKKQRYQYWTGFDWTYKELLTTESSFAYQTSPTDAFNIYSGNNGLVIGEDSHLDVEDTKGAVLLNVDWKTYDRRPA